MNYWIAPGLVSRSVIEENKKIEEDLKSSCVLFGLNKNEWKNNLITRSRKREVISYKHFARYLLSIKYNKTRQYVGDNYGSFDHSTITSSIQMVTDTILRHDKNKEDLLNIINR